MVFLNSQVLLRDIKKIEPEHDKTNKMTCSPGKDSDQPGHPPILITLHCPHEEALGPWLFLERTAKISSARLNRVVAAQPCQCVGFVVHRLI